MFVLYFFDYLRFYPYLIIQYLKNPVHYAALVVYVLYLYNKYTVTLNLQYLIM